MAIELFSLWGGRKGWLSQRDNAYHLSADLGDQGIWYVGSDPQRLAAEFHRACRRVLLCRLLPFLPRPPGRLSV
jgi:hypothetical protein